jgi:hypothetical protein
VRYLVAHGPIGLENDWQVASYQGKREKWCAMISSVIFEQQVMS